MEKSDKKRISKKKIFILILIIILLAGGGFCVWKFILNKEETPKGKKLSAKLEDKVDIVDLESKSRPFAISINNTPVAVKVQEGLNSAYIVYEIPTGKFGIVTEFPAFSATVATLFLNTIFPKIFVPSISSLLAVPADNVIVN